MWVCIGLIFGFVCLLAAVIALARSGGSKAAQIEAIKSEIRERQRGNKIMDTVRNMSDDDVRERLQNRTDN